MVTTTTTIQIYIHIIGWSTYDMRLSHDWLYHRCRSFTDLTRDHSLFSLATPNHPNDLLLYKKNNGIDLSIRDTAVSFPWLDYKVNTWHSICTTWDSVSGVAQLWLDGKHTARKYVSSGSHISGPIIIILGQVQCCTVTYLKIPCTLFPV